MEDASFKECPFCKEQIRKEAVKCRFCGEWFEQQASPPPSQPQEAKAIGELTHPKNENLPAHEPQAEQKQTWLSNFTFLFDKVAVIVGFAVGIAIVSYYGVHFLAPLGIAIFMFWLLGREAPRPRRSGRR